MKKHCLSKKLHNVSSITIVGSTIVNRTILREINPWIKYGGGFLVGASIIKQGKSKTTKQIGQGIIISTCVNLLLDVFQKKECVFKLEKNIPAACSILINLNSGIIVQERPGTPEIIYLTDKKDINGWVSSFKLTHCLNISGQKGGLPSKKGEPVLWSKLQEHTKEFNTLLQKWISFFENKKTEYEDSDWGSISKLWFWRGMVDDGKELDIKNANWAPSVKGEWSKYNNTLLRYDDYGNILYGAAGAAFGLNEETLLIGANLNQLKKTGFDDDKDTYSIKKGIAIYQNYYKHKIKVA